CRPGDTFGGTNEHAALLPNGLQSQQSRAASSESGVCARVTMRIEQRVAITRAAFIGTLEINNGEANTDLTHLQLTLDIRDNDQNPVNDLFAIRGPTVSGLTAVDGTGVLAAGSLGTAKFTFVPTHDAASNGPVVYKIGGTLKYTDGTNVVDVPLL